MQGRLGMGLGRKDGQGQGTRAACREEPAVGVSQLCPLNCGLFL